MRLQKAWHRAIAALRHARSAGTALIYLKGHTDIGV
jgi:hypothetical protein